MSQSDPEGDDYFTAMLNQAPDYEDADEATLLAAEAVASGHSASRLQARPALSSASVSQNATLPASHFRTSQTFSDSLLSVNHFEELQTVAPNNLLVVKPSPHPISSAMEPDIDRNDAVSALRTQISCSSRSTLLKAISFLDASSLRALLHEGLQHMSPNELEMLRTGFLESAVAADLDKSKH